MTPSLCLPCHGTGTVYQQHEGVLASEPMGCADCQGTGQVTPADAPCPTCRLPDGSPNSEYLKRIAFEHGGCVTCGGAVIVWGEAGAGYCGRCKDNSANHAECETCGQAFEDWAEGIWEPVR